RRERRRIDYELFETFFTAFDDFLIIQIAERRGQACAEERITWRFVFLWLPTEFVKGWSQDRARVGLKFFVGRITDQQTVDVVKGIDNLITLGQLVPARQLIDQF